jgi:predicted anti-sigma-YlaC factor YlaD
MNHGLHQRASQLLAQRRIEPLSRQDEQWLAAHLAECESCATADSRIGEALSALRTMQIDLPHNLASRTQLRVRLRAEELREHAPASRLIWAVAAMSWILGLATAPFVWRGFEWIGTHTGAPKLVLQFGFVLWWGLPALLAAGIVLWQRDWRPRGAE